MGLIREPKNVDFTVLDKPWTEKERKEFSAFIKLRKEQRKKRNKRRPTSRKIAVEVLISRHLPPVDGCHQPALFIITWKLENIFPRLCWPS